MVRMLITWLAAITSCDTVKAGIDLALMGYERDCSRMIRASSLSQKGKTKTIWYGEL